MDTSTPRVVNTAENGTTRSNGSHLTSFEIPADVKIYTEDDELGDIPEADKTGSQTGGAVSL